MKLTIELVPKSSWFNNLRSVLRPTDWDRLRKETYRKAKSRCEICGGRGPKWPVECHEVWKYDDKTKVQTLRGLIALCPMCHLVKHIGFAHATGKGDAAAEHLAKVNGLSRQEAEVYIEAAFEKWSWRSQYPWYLDLHWLEEQGIQCFTSRQEQT